MSVVAALLCCCAGGEPCGGCQTTSWLFTMPWSQRYFGKRCGCDDWLPPTLAWVADIDATFSGASAIVTQVAGPFGQCYRTGTSLVTAPWAECENGFGALFGLFTEVVVQQSTPTLWQIFVNVTARQLHDSGTCIIPVYGATYGRTTPVPQDCPPTGAYSVQFPDIEPPVSPYYDCIAPPGYPCGPVASGRYFDLVEAGPSPPQVFLS